MPISERAMNTGTDEEVSSTTIPSSASSKVSKNAFAELMSKKAKPQPQSSNSRPRPRTFHGRDGLGAYTMEPEAFPRSRVITYNERAVLINDMFPKSTVHTLVLPRTTRDTLHPFEAFEDPQLLAETREEVDKAKQIVAQELRRRIGKFSAAEEPRLQAMESDADELPPGRDWSKEIIAGVHAGPSMNHLHVHVLSRDMVSECLKKSNHYQSFTTPFLVPLDDFPLDADDVRRRPDRGGYLHDTMRCWRCGEEFNKIPKLKQHLLEEFERWKCE